MPFREAEFEKFYAYAKLLQTKLPKRDLSESMKLVYEVAMEYYRLKKIKEGSIDLVTGVNGELDGLSEAGIKREKEEKAALSEIIDVLNERFGTEFEEADRLFFEQIEAELMEDTTLQTQAKVNKMDTFKYAFEEMFIDKLIERMDQNQEIFEKILENQSFGSLVKELMMKKEDSPMSKDPVSKLPTYQVAAGLIRKNGKILIAKRRKGVHLAGVWEFPGGKQEKGESLSGCLERELFEELGISVRIGSRIASVDYEYPRKRIVLHGFYCTWKKGEPKPLQCQAIRWVSPRELPDLALPPPDMKILKTIINNKILEEWMKGKDMFYKKNPNGYNTPIKGVKLKSLTYGEKTHMCEFILDAGSAIPEHSHPHEQTGYLVSGKIDFLMEGKTFGAEPGDSWSVPGDMPHSANVVEDSVIVEVFSPVREEYL